MPALLTLRLEKVARPLAAVVGFLAGVSALYTSWAIYLHAVFARAAAGFPSSFWMMAHPGGVLVAMLKVNEVGVWTVRGAHPTGIVLALFWLLEAGLIIGVTTWAELDGVNKAQRLPLVT